MPAGLGRRQTGASRSRTTAGTPARSSCATRARAGPRSPTARTRGSAAPAPWSAALRLLLEWGFARAAACGPSSGARTRQLGLAQAGLAARLLLRRARCAGWLPPARRAARRLGRHPAAPASRGSRARRGWTCRCSRATALRLRPWRDGRRRRGSSRPAATSAPSTGSADSASPYDARRRRGLPRAPAEALATGERGRAGPWPTRRRRAARRRSRCST